MQILNYLKVYPNFVVAMRLVSLKYSIISTQNNGKNVIHEVGLKKLNVTKNMTLSSN